MKGLKEVLRSERLANLSMATCLALGAWNLVRPLDLMPDSIRQEISSKAANLLFGRDPKTVENVEQAAEICVDTPVFFDEMEFDQQREIMITVSEAIVSHREMFGEWFLEDQLVDVSNIFVCDLDGNTTASTIHGANGKVYMGFEPEEIGTDTIAHEVAHIPQNNDRPRWIKEALATIMSGGQDYLLERLWFTGLTKLHDEEDARKWMLHVNSAEENQFTEDFFYNYLAPLDVSEEEKRRVAQMLATGYPGFMHLKTSELITHSEKPEVWLELLGFEASEKEVVLEVLNDLVSQNGYWGQSKKFLEVKIFYEGRLYRYGFGSFLVLCGILQMVLRRINRLIQKDPQEKAKDSEDLI